MVSKIGPGFCALILAGLLLGQKVRAEDPPDDSTAASPPPAAVAPADPVGEAASTEPKKGEGASASVRSPKRKAKLPKKGLHQAKIEAPLVSLEGSDEAISRKTITMADVQEQRDLINWFQVDCLDVIKEPSSYLQAVETYRTTDPKVFLVRVRGKILEKVKVTFAAARIQYEDKKGSTRSINFNLEDQSIQTDDKKMFSFAIVIPASQSATIPLIVHEDFDQLYQLRIKIDAKGNILVSKMKPVFGFAMKRKFCIKNQVNASLGMTLFSYAQGIDVPDTDVHYISTGFPSFSAEWLSRDSAYQDKVYELKSAPGQVPGGGVFPASSYRWTIATMNYQKRSLDWNWEIGDIMVHPYLRYGVQVHSLPLLHFIKADIVNLDTIDMANASGGAGLNFFRGKYFMMDAKVNFQYPVLASQKIKYGLMFDGSLEMLYALKKNLSVGVTTYGQYHNFKYDRGSAFDSTGSVNFIYNSIEFSVGYLY